MNITFETITNAVALFLVVVLSVLVIIMIVKVLRNDRECQVKREKRLRAKPVKVKTEDGNNDRRGMIVVCDDYGTAANNPRQERRNDVIECDTIQETTKLNDQIFTVYHRHLRVGDKYTIKDIREQLGIEEGKRVRENIGELSRFILNTDHQGCQRGSYTKRMTTNKYESAYNES